MAGNNNEVTTSFNVNITQLKSAMQTARKEIALANSEFKAVSSSMDNWSESTDGLQAKLNQLDSNLINQKKILRGLEDQYELTVAEMGAGSNAAKNLQIQINNQRATVNKTEIAIQNFNKEMALVEQAELQAVRSGREVSDVLDEMKNQADDTSEGFTVFKGVLADLVADGIKATISALGDLVTDSSNAYAQFAANTGVATDAMGEYEEAIKSIYKNNFGESLEDVANKMARVKEVTGELDASKLEDMTKKAITLEDTFGMDMTETLRGVQSLISHFGLTAEEAFDYLASGAQNGLNYTDELGDNISEYAGKFAEAGYSTEEYFQLLQNGSDGGAYNLDKVNDAINEVTARLADGTIEDSLSMFSSSTQDVFKQWQNGEATQKQVIDSIVKDIQNTTGEQEKMNLAAKAFGTMAEDGGTQFISSLTSVGNTYDEVKGKAEELANVKYDTPQAAIQGIGRTIKTDLLQPLIEDLMPYIQLIADWVEENLPAIIQKIKEVGGVISALSPIIVALGVALAGLALVGMAQNITKIIGAMKTWASSTKLVTAAQWLLNAAQAASPITLIIIAVMALVAAFVVLWKKSEAFRNFWTGLWNGIKSTFDIVMSGIVKFFTKTIPNTFNGVINWIKANWSTLLTFLINPFAGLFKYFYQNNSKFREFVDNAVSAIKEMPSKIWTWLLKTINKVSEFGSNLKAKGREAANNLISSIVDKLRELPDDMRNIGENVVRGLWNGINNMTDWIISKIKGFGNSVTKGLKDFFKIKSPSRLMRDEIGKYIPEGIAVGIDRNVDSVLSSMKNLTAQTVATARDGLGSATGNLSSGSSVSGGVVNNFYQTNNSPKALSRLEIYRQSKNLLGYAGGN